MFNSLRGTITAVGANYIRIETAGVEWELEVSAESARSYRAGAAGPGAPGNSAAGPGASGPGAAGPEARILVHLYHREDTMRLFGFATEQERRLFLELLKVGGIGPKQAMRILSGAHLEAIVRAIDEGAVEELARFPGLGTKTAQKIVLTLKDKLTTVAGPSSAGQADDELVEALVSMGFDRKKARSALSEAAEQADTGDTPAEERESALLRQAIVLLS